MATQTHLPTLFVSHGAPTLALTPSPAHEFLAGLGRRLPRPKAIVVFSAHWETRGATVTATARPETIHDFFGFPEPLYQLRYPAPGAPELAADIVERLQAANIPAVRDTARGLDHGAWVPLLLAYPDADIPVVQVSLQTHLGPAHHLQMGRALASLRDRNILILASGGATHNLREFLGQPQDAAPADYAVDFADWLKNRLDAHELDALLDYRRQGPQATRNHPTEEHFLPLFAALGAADGASVTQWHHSFSYGVLAMDAYAFGAESGT